MEVGKRLRETREAKNLSQGDIEHRTGLLRCYISRVENGHTVPSVETIEKLARAFEIPTYQLFIGADEKPSPVPHAIRTAVREKSFGSTSKEQKFFIKFWRLLSKMSERDRTVLLAVAGGMARGKK
ncbi:MAG: helix-turn-helix transcriptional regulator [Candidatus Acidiferrales bacterium]